MFSSKRSCRSPTKISQVGNRTVLNRLEALCMLVMVSKAEPFHISELVEPVDISATQ